MTLRAHDVMQRDVWTVHPDMSLAAAEEALLQHGVSGAPVVDHGQVVGIISRSDMVRTAGLDRSLAGVVSGFYRQIADVSGEGAANQWKRAQGFEAYVEHRQVRDVMTAELITVAAEAPIQEVARVLIERRIHRVLVTEGRKLLGLISTSDLVLAIANGRLREP